MDILLTGIVLLQYGAVAICGIKASDDAKERFMNIDYTTTMKGLCCIVVVFVHVPLMYQNKLQDAIGSFAFISVTMFMLFSGYGIAYGIRHKRDFFNKFISYRLLVVFIPFMFSVAIKWICGFNPLSGGAGYIKVILLFYIVTYISYALTKKFGGGGVYGNGSRLASLLVTA